MDIRLIYFKKGQRLRTPVIADLASTYLDLTGFMGHREFVCRFCKIFHTATLNISKVFYTSIFVLFQILAQKMVNRRRRTRKAFPINPSKRPCDRLLHANFTACFEPNLSARKLRQML